MKIVGVDEVGLGCLAGPVIAAAVVLGNFKGTITFKDSKKTRIISFSSKIKI